MCAQLVRTSRVNDTWDSPLTGWKVAIKYDAEWNVFVCVCELQVDES